MIERGPVVVDSQAAKGCDAGEGYGTGVAVVGN